jgi:hypothetical protein
MAKHRAGRALRKRVNKGFIGHPLATVIFYGPTDKKATKLVVGIFRDEDADLDPMHKWTSTCDVRNDPVIVGEMLDFLRQHDVRSVSMPERIAGCPHEEGIDYPEGQHCPNPECTFWIGRDRWSGEIEN